LGRGKEEIRKKTVERKGKRLGKGKREKVDPHR